MARWRMRRYDGEGVIDLGPVPGRMGRKGIRQYLQGIAVRSRYDETIRAPTPIDPEKRAALVGMMEGGSLIAHEADGAVFTAEQDKSPKRA